MGRKGEGERNISLLPLTREGLNPKPEHEPSLGTQPATFWCTGLTLNQLSHVSQG